MMAGVSRERAQTSPEFFWEAPLREKNFFALVKEHPAKQEIAEIIIVDFF